MPLLTEKQAETFSFIKSYIADNGFPPTRSEVADHFDVAVNAIQERIDGLIKKGALTPRNGKARSVMTQKP